jgi:hypothetical protein
VSRRRARWKGYQGRINPPRLVFIDETLAKTSMTPQRGWGARGQRLIEGAPHGHWHSMTFIAALRHDRIEAPFVLDGPVNGTSFQAYIEQVLVPTLAPAMWWSWTISDSTRGRPSARPSGRQTRTCSVFRLTARISTQQSGLCKAETDAARDVRANSRSDMAQNWRFSRPLYPKRMRNPSRQCRICFKLISARCSWRRVTPERIRWRIWRCPQSGLQRT